jgi:hypothetical protein
MPAFSTTAAASALAARAALPGASSSTATSTSGVAPARAGVAVRVCVETVPRSCPGRTPAARAARRIAASERTISPTVSGCVARLWTGAPPAGENGWPRYSTVSAR